MGQVGEVNLGHLHRVKFILIVNVVKIYTLYDRSKIYLICSRAEIYNTFYAYMRVKFTQKLNAHRNSRMQKVNAHRNPEQNDDRGGICFKLSG